MWFRKIKIVNVGPFADFQIDLTRGSIGVFGRNGKGKSTLLNLMFGLVTNDFGRYAGVRADLVRNTAEAKAQSYICGEVEHAGQVIEITRNFRPTKANPGTSVVIADTTFTDANKAQAKIYEALGVDGKLLDLYVFKEQHRIYDFLTSIPSERAKAYATLCQTEECEQVWNVFGDFLNKDKDVNAEIVDNSDELAVDIANLEADVEHFTEQIATAKEKLCEDKHLAKYNKRIDEQRRLDSLNEQKLETEGEYEVAVKAAKKKEKALVEHTAALDDVNKRYESRKTKADDTRAALKSWDAYRQYRKQRKRLKEEQDDLTHEGEKIKPPTAAPDVDKLEAFNKRLVRMEDELTEAKKTVSAFQTTGLTACPTCKTPVDHLKEHLEAARAKVKTLPAEIKTLEDAVEAIDTYKIAARQYEKWRAGYDARVKANTQALDGLKQIEAPEGSEDELKAWLDKWVALEKERGEITVAYRQTERGVEQAKAAVTQLQDSLDKISQKLSEIDVKPSDVEKAKRRLAEHQVATNEVASLEGERKGSQRQLEAKQSDLKKLKAKLKKSRRIRQMAKVIEEAREVVHRDRLPRRVAQMNLARMEGDINEQLKVFGDPFWVEADDSLSFQVNKIGEPPQPAARLSTGQRVVLALAFWPAVASLWQSELGMLALDEPTANLDGENRKLLRDALGAMTAKVRGERQLIMVTHDPDLRTAFDQVVDLGG